MADFLIAYKLTARNEGGYSNDPVDPGGETWRGIARKFWPRWKGWAIVDHYKGQPDFVRNLEANAQLYALELEFYKAEFWDRIKGDEIKIQSVANSIYDNTINVGLSAAIRLAQRAIGIAETGVLNDETLKAINFE